ncbi:DoxX family protein [Terriglobus sp. 2YAB30_2]|uniref:DoxX family protein n=1 Tax=unclassified Terriglobus TaxID=2628988 RepID=UPI003F98C995
MQSAIESAQSSAPAPHFSRKRLWAGRVITVIAILFLLFDAAGKLLKISPVLEAFARLGYSASLAPGIAILLLVCTVIYAIPRTSIFGAVLLTAYLGGAVSANVRVNDPLFETLFPAIFGVLMWSGLLLRDDRLLKLFPLRS